MKKGDLVIVGEEYPSAGDTGIIIEIIEDLANVYWACGRTYWVDLIWLEVLNESR